MCTDYFTVMVHVQILASDDAEEGQHGESSLTVK